MERLEASLAHRHFGELFEPFGALGGELKKAIRYRKRRHRAVLKFSQERAGSVPVGDPGALGLPELLLPLRTRVIQGSLVGPVESDVLSAQLVRRTVEHGAGD